MKIYNNYLQCYFIKILIFIINIVLVQNVAIAQQGSHIVSYEPANLTNSKHIVLINGESKYYSEESLPMLAKILTHHHGFKTTVLFPVDPQTGKINSNYKNNIPGLEKLQNADLMILSARYQEWPDAQMEFFEKYLQHGKPIIGIRTATHAFRYQERSDSPYAKYSFRSDESGWEGGFGKKIFGETWVDHHGDHGNESTRGLINGIKKRGNHPIIRGVSDIWVLSDVYGIRDLEDNVDILLWGQSTMGLTSDAPVNLNKSIMPVAWTKNYTLENGNSGRAFMTTMGASVDMVNEDLRRLLVNACYWALELENEVQEKSNVDIVGEYNPTMFDF